ncbi:hypothetical protein ABB02_00324 [Clostridiaceae bacterium JG1575]|nr:hypothetical protein ABB02_00324 [Clostridiaceae bacterium JG1575]
MGFREPQEPVQILKIPRDPLAKYRARSLDWFIDDSTAIHTFSSLDDLSPVLLEWLVGVPKLNFAHLLDWILKKHTEQATLNRWLGPQDAPRFCLQDLPPAGSEKARSRREEPIPFQNS